MTAPPLGRRRSSGAHGPPSVWNKRGKVPRLVGRLDASSRANGAAHRSGWWACSTGKLARCRGRRVHDSLHQQALIAFLRDHAALLDPLVRADTLTHIVVLHGVTEAAAAARRTGRNAGRSRAMGPCFHPAAAAWGVSNQSLSHPSSMPRMSTKFTMLFGALALCASPARADTCEAIQAQIDAKLRAGGLTAYTLSILDLDATTTGKVVGSCGLGRKKIVYTAGPAGPMAAVPAAAAPQTAPAASVGRSATARPGDEHIVTECKDGFIGPDCRQRRSPPVTLAPDSVPGLPAPATSAPSPSAAR